MDWTATYRIVDSRHTKSTYYAADTRADLETWLEKHAQWVHTSSADFQSRVSRTSMSTTLEIVERCSTVDTEGTPMVTWVRSVDMAELIGRITPGHERAAQLA